VRFNKLDLNLLVALDVLLKERSVTRAAEVLNLSPSAVSNALAKLREYFEDELLVQIGRKMELTPRAESLQDAVRDLLLRIDSTIGAPAAFDPRGSDRMFRIFASDYTQMVLGPALMTLAAQQHATVRFEFAPQVSQPHRYLERGEADLLTRRVAVLTYSFITLPALLVGTDRVATVHERVARRLVGVWPLEIRPTPMHFEPMEQAMQWHKFRSNDPGLTWLRGLIGEAARRIDAV
jgi:DNA-binding transcriptional LysR family regulator